MVIKENYLRKPASFQNLHNYRLKLSILEHRQKESYFQKIIIFNEYLSRRYLEH